MKTLEVLFTKAEGMIHIQAPCVGFIRNALEDGTWVNSKSKIGILRTLGTDFLLRLPSGVGGKISDSNKEIQLKGVGYGQRIFSLLPLEIGKAEETKEEPLASQSQIVILAPSHGIFYRRPSPDASPYVELGSIVKTGQVLGLLEVMKCFTQILYGGPTLPSQAKVVDICAVDGSEIQMNQVLFRFENV